MAFLEIPIRSDIPAYNFQINLEGIIYTLGFRYNSRLERWVMDVKDVDEVALVTGVPLLYGIPLLDRYKNPALPPGTFILIDETNAERNPTRDGLGEDYKLLYKELS